MRQRITLLTFLMVILFGLNGCIGMVIGQTADAAIEVVKIPFKVGGAVIDVATGGDDDDDKEDK